MMRAWGRARVRRHVSVPFSPRAVADLQGWWEAVDLAELASGETVATWRDLSGHNRDATQDLTGKRPTFQTDQVTGLPSVRFDGLDDSLVGSSGLSAGSSVTMFVVANSQGSSPRGRVFSLGTSVPGRELGLGADTTGTRLAVLGFEAADATVIDRETRASNRGWHVASLVYVPGGLLELRRNGGDALTFTFPGVRAALNVDAGMSDPPFALGAAAGGVQNPCRVALTVVLLYGRALDENERAQIERWLGARYGIDVI